MQIDQTVEEKITACPPSLQQIIEEFREATPRERIDYLIDFSDNLPDLPERLRSRRDEMEQVHECQTPVFLYAEKGEDGVHFYIDVSRESPTVRGYAAILVEGLDGVSPEEVLTTPDDVHQLLALHEAISPQRLRGLHALVRYMKRQAARLL